MKLTRVMEAFDPELRGNYILFRNLFAGNPSIRTTIPQNVVFRITDVYPDMIIIQSIVYDEMEVRVHMSEVEAADYIIIDPQQMWDDYDSKTTKQGESKDGGNI